MQVFQNTCADVRVRVFDQVDLNNMTVKNAPDDLKVIEHENENVETRLNYNERQVLVPPSRLCTVNRHKSAHNPDSISQWYQWPFWVCACWQ